MLKREFIQQRIKKAEAPAQKAEDTRPHELTNIRVEEVSLVDAPANRRKFLVTKRDRTLKVAPAEEAAKGTGETVVVDGADVVDLTTTGKADLPGADLDRADAERARKEREAEEEREREREKQLVGAVKTEDPPKEETPKEEPKSEPEKPKEEPSPEVKKPKEEAPGASDPDKTPPVVPAATPAAKAEEVPVDKVGKPMARARLDRLKAQYKALGELISELDVDAVDDVDKGANSTTLSISVEELQAAAAKAGPGGLVWVENGVLMTKAAAEPPKVETVKTDANAAEIKRLTAVVESLQKMVKEQGEQLAKSRMPVNSNAISLEKSENGHDKVLWDPDMASPTARVKGRSF
jgi:hypothetical protein